MKRSSHWPRATTRASRSRRSTRRAAYTLVELMMIVAVIAVSVVAFTPGFTRAMADRRVSNAARELIRIGRRARSESFGYLRAHLVTVDPTNGRVQLMRGPTNSCSLTDWKEVAKDCPAAANAILKPRCLENVFLASLGDTIALWQEGTNGEGKRTYSKDSVALCFGPNGVVSHGSGATLDAVFAAKLVDTNTIGGGYVFNLLNGTESPKDGDFSRVHRVLLPLGGTARSLR